MIDREDLDFVVIATPTKLHYPMVKYTLQNKLHGFFAFDPKKVMNWFASRKKMA